MFVRKLTKLFIVLLALAIGFMPAAAAFAEADGEASVIRVGYYPMANYHARDESGSVAGYEAEYLNKISRLTGWTFKYIEAASWSDAVEMLRQGDVDIISPAQMTPEFEDEFAFSALPLGKDYGAVMVPSSNTSCCYEDYAMFSDMVFGVEDGTVYKPLFSEYADLNGFTPKAVKVYKSFGEMSEALRRNEIDAVASSILQIDGSMKLVGRFSASAFYLMFRRGDSRLEAQLNKALFQIDIDYPNLGNELEQRYFPSYSQVSFTRDEIEFAKSLPTLRVGCQVDIDPVSYLSTETGEVDGICRDVLDIIAAASGLSFEYVALPSGDVTYDVLRSLDIDIIAGVEQNSCNAQSPGLSLTQPYFYSQKVVVGKQGVVYKRDASLTLAVSTGSQTLIGVLKSSYPNFTIVRYRDNLSCMEAIVRGDADVMIQNQYVVQSLLAKPLFDELSVIPSEGINDNMCLSPLIFKAGPSAADPVLSDIRLVTILNKGISSVTQEQISSSLIAHTTDRPYPFVLGDFIYRYRQAFITLAAALVLLAVGLTYIYKTRRRNVQLVLHNENKLRSITNNIDGGVIVLRPDDKLQIIYANDGFFNLLQFSHQEYENVMRSGFMTLVHDDDKAALKEQLSANCHEQGKISLHVRICRKDGKYIPTRFNGTCSFITAGRRQPKDTIEIYCALMDISQETAMLEKLDLEQRKRNLIIDKSNEIIYEINMETNEIIMSEAFRNTFGWNPSGGFTNIIGLVNTWKVHKEDQSMFLGMIKNTVDGNEDSGCLVRMLTASRGYRWFSIAQYVMKDSSNTLNFIMGKIIDVDDHVREVQLLERKSQLDAMTGLYNKQAFTKLAGDYLAKTRDRGAALLFVDLDGFKKVNDLLGHMAGDNAIIEISKRLQIIFSGYDLLSRFGGDEFCILVKEIPWKTLLEKIDWTLGRLSMKYSASSRSIELTASIGVARTADCGFEVSELLRCADAAMYEAKEQGKNRYAVYQADNPYIPGQNAFRDNDLPD